MTNTQFTVDNKMSPQQIKLHDLVKNLLIVLSDKEKFIIENRFALETGNKLTLESIGSKFGVTRERVRQIEKSALKKLERNAQNTNIRILSDFAKALLAQEGGIAKDRHFKEIMMELLPNITEENLQDLHLALTLDPDIRFESNTLKHHPHWRLSNFDPGYLPKVASIAVKALQKTKHVLSSDKLTERVNATLGSSLEEISITNILRISKECKFTGDGIGLYSGRHIHPRTLRDKINYTFQKEKKPLHFQKIADLIKGLKFDQKRINVQAVHNELIRNEDFILIGRGIYALQDWGYKTGTVADVIAGILADGKARSREEITKAVLEQRHVKTITIYLNLKNKDQFARVGRDKYTLKKFAN